MRACVAVGCLLSVVLAGCVDPEPVVYGDCDSYPTREELRASWSSRADSSGPETMPVSLVMNVWREDTHDWDVSSPPPFVEWEDFSRQQRPPIVADLLCHAIGRDLERGEGLGRSSGFTGAPIGLAEDAMDALRSETVRQTGADPESCCVVRFNDHYYTAGLNFDSNTWSSATWGTTGFVEYSMNVGGEQVFHNGTEPYEFFVHEMARVVHIEATWEHEDYALDLVVRGPDERVDWDFRVGGGSFMEPHPPLNLTLYFEEIDAWNGWWEVDMMAPDVAEDVEYTVAITVFRVWELPSGYSRLP